MKRILIPLTLILMLPALACSFTVNLPNIKSTTGPTRTVSIDETVPATDQPARVILKMGAGTFTLAPGGESLISGTIRYNVPEWRPVTSNVNNTVTIREETTNRFTIPNNVVNDWNLKLSPNQLMDLSVEAGAYQGNMNLSGLKLADLSISDGASQTEVHFNSPNPVTMQRLTYKTGASQVKLYGLAYANFQHMTFDSGAGSYTLDFTGALKSDASVDIRSGVSEVTIIVPNGMSARVYNQGGISSVDTQGAWTSAGNSYSTQGSGPALTINVEMGVGSLKLRQP